MIYFYANTMFITCIHFIGVFPNEDSWIKVEDICNVVDTLEDLVYNVWGEREHIVNQSKQWISERAILSPRNDAVNTINEYILEGVNSAV